MPLAKCPRHSRRPVLAPVVFAGRLRHPIERVAVAEDVGTAGVLMLAGPFVPEGG